jgi:hypothetical protein
LSASSKEIKLQMAKPEGQFVPSKHNYLLKLHTIKPKQVLENGLKKMDWSFNEKEKVLYIRTVNDKRTLLLP